MPLKCIKDKTARQCRAKAKGTGQQCKNPAVKDRGMGVCRYHGYHRRTAEGEANGRYVHGEKTNELKDAHKLESQEIKKLKEQLKKSGQIN